MNKSTLSAVLYGDAGEGKSTLAYTARTPLLIIDAEGGAGHAHAIQDGIRTRYPLEYWEAGTEPPSGSHVVYRIESFPDLVKLIGALEQSCPFKSVVVDSLSEVQKLAKKEVEGAGDKHNQDLDAYSIEMRHWTYIYGAVDDIIWRLRKILTNPSGELQTLIFTALIESKFGKQRPQLQGKLGQDLPSLLDLTAKVVLAKDDQGNTVQKMGVASTDLITAKMRIPEIANLYGDVIESPDMAQILEQIEKSN